MKKFKFKCWIEEEGEKFYGPGPHQLIKSIQKEGSLSKAAGQMNMSYKKDWDRITPVLREALGNVTEEKLNENFEMGEEKMTVFDLVTFLAHREAYCIGQIALYRRLLGYEAMKYM